MSIYDVRDSDEVAAQPRSDLWEEAFNHVSGEAGRAHGLGIQTAPARLDFGQHFLAAFDDRLIEGACPGYLFQ